jgi:ubiquinone/menaquinone biosynthesis C-methylase UbiE
MMEKRALMSSSDHEAPTYDISRDFYEKGYAGKRERELLRPFLCTKHIVLDLACGTGRLLPFLAKSCSEVVGLDFSGGMLAVSKRKTKVFQNIHLVLGDAENLPFREGVFDEIVCSRAFKFFPSPLKALIEGRRCLKSGGRFILSLETSDPLWIKILLRLVPPTIRSFRYEWRYKKKDVLHLFEKAGLKIYFSTCLIYFGRSVYELVDRLRLPPLHNLLRLIDARSSVGRNILIVGEKNRLE